MNQAQKLAKSVETLSRLASEPLDGDSVRALASAALVEIATKPRSAFQPPTLEELRAYIDSRPANGRKKVDAQKFLDHYEMVGWVVGAGRKPMKNWQAAVRTWEADQPKVEERTVALQPLGRFVTPHRRLAQEDCESAAAFEDWWQQQQVLPKTEQFHINAHAVRILANELSDPSQRFPVIQARLGWIAKNKVTWAVGDCEDRAAAEIRELRNGGLK